MELRNIDPSLPTIFVSLDSYLMDTMTFVYRQIVELRRSFNVIVLAPFLENRSYYPHEPVVELSQLPFSRFCTRTLRQRLGYITSLDCRQEQLCLELARAYRPDAIHAHFGPAGIRVASLAAKLGIPLVVTFHGFDLSCMLRWLAYRWQIKRLVTVIVSVPVSEYFKKRLLGLGAAKEDVRVIHVGIPLDRYVFRSRNTRTKVEAGEEIAFLQVARFTEKKGHIYTVDAFAELLKTHGNVRLVLAGDGPSRSAIERRVAGLGLSDKVTFLGFVVPDRVPALMDDCDVLLQPSVIAANGDEEGVPTTLMEAMACGLPVIATSHAGIPELVVDGRTGFLATERCVDSLTRKMVQVMRTGIDIPHRARATIEESFADDGVTKQLVTLFCELTTRKSRDGGPAAPVPSASRCC